ncbi:MAG: sulfatase activating formylglycine-generating enzyme [Crocinitomix sp.]|jgi:formylglycine-generating enzyme required for sulfatase activity
MKPLYIFFISLLFTTSQGHAMNLASKASHQSPKKEIVPPGTVKFNDGLYVDMTELSNFSWLEYIYWMKTKYGKSSKAYEAVMPDTMAWRNTNLLFETIYLRHPSFYNYPVVGITYEQAVGYCTWRSDRVNEMIFAQNNKVEYHFYKEDSTFYEIPKICNYRLPTEEEWESFAIAPFSKKVLRKQKTDPIYNVAGTNPKSENTGETSDATTSTTAFWPNIYGQYNLIGNVAEMVAEKGKSKGGSWIHSEEESSASNSIEYTKPNVWLGFRCVCEVKQP